MKRFIAYVTCIVLLLSCMPISAMAANPRMNDNVPVWTEDTVRKYALDYIAARDIERLWNYYDLQIRRYIPQSAFENFLIDLEFLSGDFIALGSYRSFENEDGKLKTHVLHLCMEKLDIDMYFTHKNEEDDWEVMALEFVPAEEETIIENEENTLDLGYSETVVTVGTDEYPLEGLLTMPNGADMENPVPACVFVHDFGAYDRDHTLGNTAMFKDFSKELAEMGIASIRYDKRIYTYPDYEANTVYEEVVEDALSAAKLLADHDYIDEQRIVVVGLGLGAMLSPRIAKQSEGIFTAMIMIGGKPVDLLDAEYARAGEYLNSLSDDERSNEKYIVRNFDNYSDERVMDMTILGRKAYYYREADEYSQVRMLQKLKLPVFIAQGERDAVVSENDGRRAYQKQIGSGVEVELETFRNLNHLLMNDLSTDASGAPLYEAEAHIDKQTARILARWIHNLYSEEE